MEHLRFKPGDLAIVMWPGPDHLFNNGIIVKIIRRVENDEVDISGHQPGDVFWWIRSQGVPLRRRARRNLVKRMEICAIDSALQRLCGAPDKQLETTV